MLFGRRATFGKSDRGTVVFLGEIGTLFWSGVKNGLLRSLIKTEGGVKDGYLVAESRKRAGT